MGTIGGAVLAGALGRVIAAALVLAALVLAAALPTGSSMAMWARLSDAELFDRSDLIVTGTLIGQTRVRIGTADLTVGVIDVKETFKGEPAEIAVLVLPTRGQPVSSDALPRATGDSGLWYLRLRTPTENGLYVADHPQRFVPAAEAEQAIKDLRRRREGAQRPRPQGQPSSSRYFAST
jgi:hypothetical protein